MQIAYSDPPRQDLRELGSSENALLGPTPTEFAGNVGKTTGPVQMPCRTHPDRICRGGRIIIHSLTRVGTGISLYRPCDGPLTSTDHWVSYCSCPSAPIPGVKRLHPRAPWDLYYPCLSLLSHLSQARPLAPCRPLLQGSYVSQSRSLPPGKKHGKMGKVGKMGGKWGKMGGNGEKWGKMGKNGGEWWENGGKMEKGGGGLAPGLQ